MIKKIFISTIALTFLLLIAGSLTTPLIKPVSGQGSPLIEDFGSACFDTYPDCPNGYKNALGSVQDGSLILNGMSFEEFKESLMSSYGLDSTAVNTLCINETFENIIPRRGFSNAGNLATIDGTNYPVACPNGWNPQKGPHNATRFGLPIERASEPWACCPSGYTFVNQELDEWEGEDNIQQGFCCQSSQNPYKAVFKQGDTDNWSGPGCYSANDRIIYNAEKDDDGTRSPGDNNGDQIKIDSAFILSNGLDPNTITEDEIYSLMEQSPIIAAVYDLPSGSPYIKIATGQGSLGNAANPQLGATLGRGFSSNATTNNDRILTGQNEGSLAQSCPDKGCAVYDLSWVPEKLDSTYNGRVLGYNIVNSNSLRISVSEVMEDFATTHDNVICERCFKTGEAIAVQYDTQLLICNPDNEEGGYVDEAEIINNDIDLTLAVYRAPPGVNRDLNVNCAEQGGIMTAVGCIDPTPLGILTGLIRISLGVVGGVALLQLILAGLAYQSGNEENIQKAQGRIFATMGGLAVLIFSVLILRIIGVNILDVIPSGLV